jgi:hypothetical protein
MTDNDQRLINDVVLDAVELLLVAAAMPQPTISRLLGLLGQARAINTPEEDDE